jgi:hypothetical protein
MEQKGTSCNVIVQFHIQIIHGIWLAYGVNHGVDITHWICGHDLYHLGMTLVMNGRTSTHKKKLELWCLKKPFVNSTCHWISPRTLKLFFDKKTETTKIPRKRLCNDIYDTCHNWKTFKTLFLKLIGPFMITNTFFENNTWIGSFQWKGIWKD